jgi:hypothetical protein
MHVICANELLASLALTCGWGNSPSKTTSRSAWPSSDQVRRKEDEDRRYKSLFSGCKFFLSREVPRESLEFVVKALGGQVRDRRRFSRLFVPRLRTLLNERMKWYLSGTNG